MTAITALELVLIAFCVLWNAFFVSAEYAFVSVRHTRLDELASKGNRRARTVRKIVANPRRFIAAFQLGITLSSVALGALGEPAVARVLETAFGSVSTWASAAISVTLAFVFISVLHVVLGEIVPKSYTLVHAERVALAVAVPIDLFYTIFKPFIWVLVKSSEVVLRWMGLPPNARTRIVHSEEELKMLVAASREEGVLEEEEQAMLHKVFAFADKDAADVMVPRPDVVALPLDTPVSELLRTVLDHPYTRYPVYEAEFDDVAGVLHVRDLFSALHDRGIDRVDVRSLLRPAILVPETKPLDELLAEFRSTSNHLAIVVDEYGSVAGLATLEDLIEEIVGEIGDEFDLPETGIRRIGKGRMRIGGSFPIEEFNERFGTDLSGDDYHSIGGFVFGQLGRAPRVGDTISAHQARFEVSAVDGPRIIEVDVTLQEPAPAPQPTTDE
jgi:CBS domain containing-hemolysin-like protein